jgi:undecaprenyl-diphosphatase
MDFLKAAIFGITQGVTEFLPVSSSGHLAILHKIFIFELENELAFDVLLHFATLLAVGYYFRREITIIIKDWFSSFKGGEDRQKGRLGWYLIAGTLPAALAGFLFEEKIENIGQGDYALPIIAFMLVLIGALFIAVERSAMKMKDVKSLNLANSIWIGFAQALALIPGTSRSGVTIIAGMRIGLKREEAVKFSFLLSVPIIMGASIKKIPSLFMGGMDLGLIILLSVSFFFAFASGILSIHYLLAFSRKYKLNAFAYYRFILALVLMILFFWQ